MVLQHKSKRMNAIIKALKKYPESDIFKIARILKIEPLLVSRAQHEYYKEFREKFQKDLNREITVQP